MSPQHDPDDSDAHSPRRLCLIDASGYIFRAYHALPAMRRSSDGLPVNAARGFCAMLRKLLIDTAPWRPTHTAAIFDAGRKSFRNELHPDYKSGRPPTPEDLAPQFELVRRATAAFGVPCIDQEGFEADDLIAAYAARINDEDEARIVSSDKDLMQLVRPNVAMLDPMKERLIDADAVREKFGVDPSRTTHVQALAGG